MSALSASAFAVAVAISLFLTENRKHNALVQRGPLLLSNVIIADTSAVDTAFLA